KRYNAKNPEKGGAKKFSGGKSANELKAELLGLRERWATLQNAHLEKHGHHERVDHRSLKDQGINRDPEKHLGTIGVNRLNTHAISALLERRAAEGELERAQREVSLIDLSGDLKKAKADRLDESLKSYQPLFDSAAQKAAEEGYSERDQALFQALFKESLIQNIESGVMPWINKKTRFEIDAIAKSAQQSEERPISTPPQPAEKPAPPNGQLAEQTLSRLIEEERLAWRKSEETKLLEEAEKSRQAAWRVKVKEPKKLLGLFATDQWKSEFAFWKRNLQDEIDTYQACKKQAQDAIAGQSEKEHWYRVAFFEKAEQRLKTEHPELAKALLEQRQAKQQKAALARAKAAADKAADKAVADFKTLAAKREGKFFGYGDNGKQWGALPDALKAAIENFNKQPASARGVELERMREHFKRTPGAAEKLTQQLEQGIDRGFKR
ncbi:MAG: MobA/MobL family protein, partial [Methylovulum sp.]